jgi:7-cyano-7-deazaguanine synthase
MVDKALHGGQDIAVLCSAGLDSAVLLAHEAARSRVTPIYVHAGLSWEREEREALERLLSAPPLFSARVNPLAVLELPIRDVYPDSHWALAGTPPAYDTPDEDVYLAGRNVILLTKAAIFCTQRRIPRVAIGILAGNPFPDATEHFFTALQQALALGLDRTTTLEAPFRALSKAQVVALGESLGVPFGLTLSCMRPKGGIHCGACSKCRERHDAFVEAGAVDPATYDVPLPRSRTARA